MTKKIISAFILLVIGLAFTHVVSNTADSIYSKSGQISFVLQTAGTDYTFEGFDFDNKSLLENADVYVDGDLYIDDGQSILERYKWEVSTTNTERDWSFTSMDTGAQIDIDLDNLTYSHLYDAGIITEGAEIQIEYMTPSELQSYENTNTVVNLVPIIYVIVLVSAVVLYIKIGPTNE